MIFLRQSTASQELLLPRMVDSTDGNTPETGLTIAASDIKVHKSGATTQADKNSGGATHISNGDYYCVLDATDTDTIGPLVVTCHPSGALYTRVQCAVLDEAVYDVIFGTTAPSTHTAAAVQALVAAGVVASVTGSVGSVTGNVGGNVTGSVGSVVGAVGSVTARVTANTDQLAGQTVTAAAGVTFPTSVASPTNITAGTITTVTNLTNAPTSGDLTATMKASVNAEVDTALADVGLTTTITGRIDAAVSTRASQASLDTVDDFLDTEVAAIKAKTDNLPSDPADASDIAASFATVNTKLDTIDDFLDTEIAALTTAVGDVPTNAELATALDAIPTAVENADALIGRNVAGGSSTGRTVKQALAAMRNKVVRSGSTLTVYDTDDTTVLWTAAITTDASADPLTAIDPG